MNVELLCTIGPIVAWYGLYLCFPNQPRLARILGALLALAGIGAATIGFVRCYGSPLLAGALIPVGIAAVFLAGRMITHPSAVYAAVYFGGVIVAVALIALLLGATFLAAALLIVYGGAILVAYVFVIMLAQRARIPSYDREARQPGWAAAAGAALLMAIVLLAQRSAIRTAADDVLPAGGDNVPSIGAVLYTDYAVAIEVAGLLLLVAIVGAIVLTSMQVAGETGPTPARRQSDEREVNTGV